MKLIADVSAIIPYVLQGDHKIEEIIAKDQLLISPILFISECGNTWLKYLYKKLIGPEDGYYYLNLSLGLIAQFIDLNSYAADILQLAYEQDLSYYDAEYLFLTLAMNGRLVSRDEKLNKAALSLGVIY